MVVRSYTRVPTAIVPLPVAVSRKLGCGAGTAWAEGTKLHEDCAFFNGAGLLGAVNFSNSAILSLSAERAKVRCGAWKFDMPILPVAVVEAMEALMFVRLIEFWVN